MTFHLAHPGITAHHVLAECARELEQRRSFYPRRIAEGRMTQAEADAQLAIAAAWHADVARVIAFEEAAAGAWAGFLAGSGPVPPLPAPDHALSWATRREGLRRELAMRARVWPSRIAEGRMSAHQAQHRRECLMALAARYDDGFDWRASNGQRTHFGRIDASEDILAARREWDAHRAALQLYENPPQQQELLMT
jgi:hypothetical protein